MARQKKARFKAPRYLAFYHVFFKALAPLWRWHLRQRYLRHKESAISLDHRWMRSNLPLRPQGPLIWGHAVGLGETLALLGFFQTLAAQHPEAHFLITSNTQSSAQALAQQSLNSRYLHCFAPLDDKTVVNRFLDYWRPDMACWCEMDLWPALVYATAERNIPRLLINVQLHQKSKCLHPLLKWIYRPLLQSFDEIWVQNLQSAQYLQRWGIDPDCISLTGNIKAWAPPLSVNHAQWQQWKALNRPIWVLASSHPSEEALAIKVHQYVLQTFTEALLIIVPREPLRAQEIAPLCPSNTLLRQAEPQTLPSNEMAYYIANTIGELGLWYRLSPIAMIGGSWSPIGGHNPYEATRLGCHVVYGPHTHHFKESYADIQARQQGSFIESSPPKIAAKVIKQLQKAS